MLLFRDFFLRAMNNYPHVEVLITDYCYRKGEIFFSPSSFDAREQINSLNFIFYWPAAIFAASLEVVLTNVVTLLSSNAI